MRIHTKNALFYKLHDFFQSTVAFLSFFRPFFFLSFLLFAFQSSFFLSYFIFSFGLSFFRSIFLSFFSFSVLFFFFFFLFHLPLFLSNKPTPSYALLFSSFFLFAKHNFFLRHLIFSYPFTPPLTSSDCPLYFYYS